MPMEQETMGLLVTGFSIVMGLAVLVTILLWMRNRQKSSAFIWVFIHFGLFSIAVYFALKAISFDYQHPMASEEVSLRLGSTGFFWFLSMISLLIGFFQFVKIKNRV